MVKILMFIPHLNMKSRFEDAISKIPPSDDIKIDMIHVFGTPDSLSKNRDADIMVARGMTYDRLHKLFPEKHTVEIQLTSFDILDALVKCKETYHPKRIALCVYNQDIKSLLNLELLCETKIDVYDVCDENSAKMVIEEAQKIGTDVFVGAGTICGLCDQYHIPRIHIETKDDSIDHALLEAVRAARTINLERAKSNMIHTILNNSTDAIIAINGEGSILAINNQAYLTYQISTLDDMKKQSIELVCKGLKWKRALKSGKESEELLKYNDKTYYVQYKPIFVDKQGAGTIIITQNSEHIVAAETKIRRSLSEKGLTAKYTFENIIGSSNAIRENIKIAKRYSQVDSNVLIVGETGTGKELFAHSIHNASKRCHQPFVALNCAALPENLLESELFGYEEGAFSGALKGGKIGLFELAHKGTIFLDEIGEIPIALQAKLLRVLQEKEIRRIGSNRLIPIDVRVLSATNINIEKQIKEGKFRSDLYYRLNLLDIVIPALRERTRDIQEMVDFYLARFACELGVSAPSLTKGGAKLLEEYTWPGNVRELRNICERLTVLNDTGQINEKDIRQLKAFSDLGQKSTVFLDTEGTTEEIYKHLKPRKKKKDVAAELGISRTTLWRLMKQEQEKSN